MPRTQPISFEVTPKDKAFLYNTIKTFSYVLCSSGDGAAVRKKRRDILKLALKFPPGSTPVYLQDWERKVIVHWLMKLHKLAQIRENDILRKRFKNLIDIFK